MAKALLWWALLTALGWASFPLVSRASRTPVSAMALSHLVGLVGVTLVTWLLTMVGLAPFSQETIWGVITLLLLVSLWSWQRNRLALAQQLGQAWKSLVLIELLFAASFAAYLLFRAHLPVAAHTEQPMDLALLSSILRSPAMPPLDPWLAGHTINYYYGGYLQIAQIGKALGTGPGAAYSLGLAQTFSLTVTGLVGLLEQVLPATRRPLRRTMLAMFGSLVIVLAGNLAGLLQLAESAGLFPTALLSRLSVPLVGSTGDYWWWFRASRMAQDVNVFGRNPTLITEFPAFGFILGDLHPHLMDLPVFVAGLALCLNLGQRALTSFGQFITSASFGVACSVLAMVAITNSWEVPTLLAVLALALFMRRREIHPMPRALWLAARDSCAVLIAMLLLSMPFIIQLDTPTRGIGVSYYAFSSVSLYVLAFGIWLVPAALAAPGQNASPRKTGLTALALLAGLTVGVLIFNGSGGLILSMVGIVSGGLLWLALLLLLAVLLARALESSRDGAPKEALILVVIALAISLFAEWFYLRDAFATRMNTLFKIYEQVWILLGAAAIVGLGRLLQYRGWRLSLGLVTAALMVASCAYSWLAVETRLLQDGVAPSIDGTAWLQRHAPDEHAAILWLTAHAAADDILLEAWGNEYAASESRVATLTGIPSVLGWYGHEAQWRGRGVDLAQRKQDIDTFYSGPTPQDTRQAIIQAYGIDWVIIGPVERQRYELSQANAWWEELGQAAFSRGQVIIIQVAPEP